MSTDATDVLVVGAGPAGSAAAAWAARAGHDVVLAEAAVFPRDKACGDGLTPRAIAELDRLGLGDWVRGRAAATAACARRVRPGCCSCPGRAAGCPAHGSAVPRTELDARIRQVALERRRAPLDGARAVDVERDGDRVSGVVFDADEGTRTIALPAAGRRRRRAVPARAGCSGGSGTATPPTASRSAATSGPAARRRVDLLAPGAARHRRRAAVRLRLGVPARRRRGEHRRRHAGHRSRSRRRAAAALLDALHRRSAARTGGSTGDVRGARVGAAAHGWRRVRRGRPQLGAVGDAAGLRQPAQRRGHRLRPGDRPALAELFGESQLVPAWPAPCAGTTARRSRSPAGWPGCSRAAAPARRRTGRHALARADDGGAAGDGQPRHPRTRDVVARLWRTAGRLSVKLDERPPFAA